LLSRASEATGDQSDIDEQVPLYVDMTVHTLPVTDARLAQGRQDSSMGVLKTVILNGWPRTKQNCPKETCPY